MLFFLSSLYFTKHKVSIQLQQHSLTPPLSFGSLCRRMLSACVLFVYLLDILLEHTQLQSLVQSDLSMLPNVLKTSLMVKNLVNHVQDAVNLQNNKTVMF